MSSLNRETNMAKAATTKDKGKPDKTGKKSATKKSAAQGLTGDAGKKSKDGKKARKQSAAKSSERHSALQNLARLADHPLVADLLAAGAVAAVAAIAEQQIGPDRKPSSKMVKSAGKAAAAAIGKKLMGEFGAIAGAAGEAAKKA